MRRHVRIERGQRFSQKPTKASPSLRKKTDPLASFMMLFFGRLDAKIGWTKQLHLGAQRNVNTAARQKTWSRCRLRHGRRSSPDHTLAKYLDLLSQEDALPQMILST